MAIIYNIEKQFSEYYMDFYYQFSRDSKFTSSVRSAFADLSNYRRFGQNFLRFTADNHRIMTASELITGFSKIQELFDHFGIKTNSADICAWEEILTPMMNQNLFRIIFAQYQFSLIFQWRIQHFTLKIQKAQEQLQFYKNQMYATGFSKVELLKYLHSVDVTHVEIENYQRIIEDILLWKAEFFQERLTVLYKYHFITELLAEDVFD